MTRRVVITGLGLVCGLGNTAPEVWRQLMAGASGMEKNLVLGGEAAGGVYATVQGQDGVAVIPAAAAEAFRRSIVTW